MKNSKIICAVALLLLFSSLWHAYTMERPVPSNEIRTEIAMVVGQACPFDQILNLPGLPYVRDAVILPESQQGANSRVYQSNNKIIKISRLVGPADRLGKELDALRNTYNMLRKLTNPGFNFAIPQDTYRILSDDNRGMCFVEISQALPNQINQRIYDYVYKNIDNRKLLEDLGKALAQLQNSAGIELRDDGFYYGIQHGDFQIGNIFYTSDSNTRTHTFTLIDLGNFANKKRLIHDPLYFIYFLTNVFGVGPSISNQEIFMKEFRNIETFKTKIADMVTWFINGYVSNLNPHVAKQMNENIQENANLTNVFYGADGRYLYGKGADIISTQSNEPTKKTEARNEALKFLNPIIRQAFANASNLPEAVSSKLKPVTKPAPAQPKPIQLAPVTKPVPASSTNKDSSIKSFAQLLDLCNADTVELHLSRYPNLEDLTGLGQCTNLKRLYLQNTRVSDIEEIGKLTNLEELDLSTSKEFPRAEPVLWILPLAGYVKVGEDSRDKLNPGCRNLKFVKLYGMKGVTGYHELQAQLPGLEIKIKPPTKIVD
ncbi:hypothetical protein BH09DEP1_BH09DEP1_6290 [soil metagenome]